MKNLHKTCMEHNGDHDIEPQPLGRLVNELGFEPQALAHRLSCEPQPSLLAHGLGRLAMGWVLNSKLWV